MTHATATDRELVSRARDGHPEAFAALTERYIASAHAIARSRLGGSAESDDAVQEAFLRAYERLNSLRDPGKFGPWVLTIARHEAVRIAAARAKSRGLEAGEERAATDAPDVEQREMNAILRDHVMKLPERSREVLLLHYFAGKSAREIASLLEVRRGAVLKRLQRAREQLAAALLRDLEAARPSTKTLSNQVARIAALTGALAIEQAAAGGTAAAVASTTIGLWKLLGAAALVSTVAVSVAVVTGDSGGPPQSAAIAQVNPEIEARAIAAPSAQREERENAFGPAPETTASTADQGIPRTASVAPSGARSASKEFSLQGEWRLIAEPNLFWSPPNAASARLELTGQHVVASGRVWNLSSPQQDVTTLEGQGDLIGDFLRVSLRYFDGGRSFTIDLEGRVGENPDGFVLNGTYTNPDESEPIEIIWNRVTADAHFYEFIFERKLKDVRNLAAVLRSYARAHGGALPERIEDLVPVYLDSMGVFAKELGVEIVYQPPRAKLPSGEPDMSKPPRIDGRVELRENALQLGHVVTAIYHPELPMPERLAQFEKDLAAAWGDDFMPKLIATIVYSEERLQFHISSDFDVSYRAHPAATPEGGLFVQEIRQAKRGECMNHLKQLGLVLKMFMNETPGQYSPGGWMTAYPEYLPDRRILACPNALPGTISYRMVWPTANEDEYKQLYRDLLPHSANQPALGAYVPMIIETDECSDSMGRNVLFLDGHVEFFEGQLRDHPEIAPFLDLK